MLGIFGKKKVDAGKLSKQLFSICCAARESLYKTPWFSKYKSEDILIGLIWVAYDRLMLEDKYKKVAECLLYQYILQNSDNEDVRRTLFDEMRHRFCIYYEKSFKKDGKKDGSFNIVAFEILDKAKIDLSAGPIAQDPRALTLMQVAMQNIFLQINKLVKKYMII